LAAIIEGAFPAFRAGVADAELVGKVIEPLAHGQGRRGKDPDRGALLQMGLKDIGHL